MDSTWFARSPLRFSSFRRLWLGMVISRLGDQCTIIALLWFVLELTGSGAILGAILLCLSLPAILTSPLLGRWLDRQQPRRIIFITSLARALVIGAIPALYWRDLLTLGAIYPLAVLAGALSPATTVGIRVVLPHLVPDAELERANGWLSASGQFSYLLGPALAGFLVATLHGPGAMLLDAASFVVLAGLVRAVPDIARTPPTVAAGERHAWLGFGALLALRPVRIITAMTAVFFFAYGPLEPALPLYSRDVLGVGAAGYGLLWTGYGVGALLGLLAIPLVARRPRPGVAFATIAVLWGLLLAPLAFLTALPLAMLSIGLAACAWAPYTIVETSLLQRLAPPHQRGQIFGARETVTVAVVPLGVLAGGVLLGVFSASVVIGVSALACIIVGIGGLLSPTLRSITREAQEPNIVGAEVLVSVPHGVE